MIGDLNVYTFLNSVLQRTGKEHKTASEGAER